jgi:hypothetical protein
VTEPGQGTSGRIGQSRLGIASFVLSFFPAVLFAAILVSMHLLYVASEEARQFGDIDAPGLGVLVLLLVMLILLCNAAAVLLGIAGLLRRRGRAFALLGTVIGASVFALCYTQDVVYTPLSGPAPTHAQVGRVGGPKPPEEVPRPRKAPSLSGGGDAPPTHWCKTIRATMFCRGDEGLPLPPQGETLEPRAGYALVFEFGGEEALEGERGGPGPGHAPLYAGAERIGEDTDTRPGLGATRFVKPEPFPGRPLGDLKAD